MGDLVQVDFNVFNYEEDSSSRIKAVDDPLYFTDFSDTSRSCDDSDEKHNREYIRSLKRQHKLKKDKAYFIIKRMADIYISGAAIAVLSPAFGCLALLIKLSDGGQPIYSQQRLGYKGKPIRIYKFRSMRVDAENIDKLLTAKQLKQFRDEYKIDNDPRITKIGRIIRKTSIDELPQLFNILEGDMTLIGPRPIVKAETKFYKSKKKLRKLLSVKPGLTGFWQAYARSKATYRDGLRQSMELYYADNRSLFLDSKIFFKTIISVINQEGAQ